MTTDSTGPPARGRAGVLDGTLVLDLGQVYNGPYCAWLLAQLGARVIKVEAPHGDVVRARTRDPRGPYAHLMMNADKESVVIDLKTADGREVLLRLVERADVLVENFSAGAMDRLGLDPGTLRTRNPRLVHASGTGYGTTGPSAGLSAMDLTVQATSGLMSATGYPDRPPVKAGAAVTDFLGATHLCLAVVAALLERERSGVGQRVESSMYEAAVISLCSSLSAVVDRGPDDRDPGAVPERTGNRHPSLSVAPYNVYRAADGYIAVNCPSQVHWVALVGLMGRPELLEDPRFRGPVERTESMDAVDAVVEEWTTAWPRDELAARLAAAGIPCGVVRTVPEVLRDPHLWARHALVEVDDPGRGPVPLPTAPLRLHDSPVRTGHRPAPDLGQHSRAVLTELLGLDDAEWARLRHAGAVGR